MERPAGVIAIAILLFVVALYLGSLGGLLLVSPGAVSLTAGSFLLHGLELAGPFMDLIAAAVAAGVGAALLLLHSIGRVAAVVIALAGVVLLIPKVSAEASDFSLSFLLAGLGITIRVMIVWYLWQGRVVEQFHWRFSRQPAPSRPPAG
ncbi:MAG TPA: hypothetical protein VF133_01525 [Terriglobales bacterium]